MRSLALLLAPALLLAACGGEPAPGSPEAQEQQARDLAHRLGEALVKQGAEAGSRMRELSERALTSADVERYLALATKLQSLGGSKDPQALLRVLEEQQVSMPEWGLLTSRILAAVGAAEYGSATKGLAAGDVEAVRPFVERIKQALEGR